MKNKLLTTGLQLRDLKIWLVERNGDHVTSCLQISYRQIMSKENKDNKSDKLVIGLILVSALLITFSFIAPKIFTNTSYYQQIDFKNTGAIGDTIGGLMNPFIALAGVFITFLAFYMQLKANKIQIEQFNKNQTEQTNLLKEQLFFRLVDNLNQRIINFSDSDSTSYKSLDNLVNTFLNKIDYECIKLGRQLLAKQPEKIDLVHYIKILQATTSDFPSQENAEALKQSVSDRNHDRWEFIKNYVGSTDTKNKKVNDALKSIGRVNFYKIPFEERESIYIQVYDEIYDDFGGFVDGYTKNLSYIMDFIRENHENSFFIKYLKSNLSSQELRLLFYFCASRKSDEVFRHNIHMTNLLENIVQSREKFIDLPSVQELKMEIEFILMRPDIYF